MKKVWWLLSTFRLNFLFLSCCRKLIEKEWRFLMSTRHSSVVLLERCSICVLSEEEREKKERVLFCTFLLLLYLFSVRWQTLQGSRRFTLLAHSVSLSFPFCRWQQETDCDGQTSFLSKKNIKGWEPKGNKRLPSVKIEYCSAAYKQTILRRETNLLWRKRQECSASSLFLLKK